METVDRFVEGLCAIKENEFTSKESIARMESRANKGSALLWKTYPLTGVCSLRRGDALLGNLSHTCQSYAAVRAEPHSLSNTPSTARRNSQGTTCCRVAL